jgi:FtsP/CotA-like multicopper oxidase with cupredoxin domain
MLIQPVDYFRVFDLETSAIRWTILPGVAVDAYAFNGQIPGPRLRFREGDMSAST